ncbi:MAG TPA: CoA transferase [Steroidobacteraceae bacterium]|nr:CoA transferase [Steroidobacteraceae bacterium]
MSSRSLSIAQLFWKALNGDPSRLERLQFVGEGELPSCFPVTDFASASIASAALSIGELAVHAVDAPAVTVNRRLASLWFGWSIEPIGWKPPAPWDPIAGDYPARDGWIRLHTNAPHHRAAAERVLGRHRDKATMAHAVAGWTKAALEAAVVEAGGCAAEMRSTAEWLEHSQGRAVSLEPLVHMHTRRDATAHARWVPSRSRPLAGIRVLDLTRVLAGPVATRFLAAYGAEVLRIDPPDWDEPGVVPEVTLGKRCARLDLKTLEGRSRFELLLAGADVLVHGYRPGALERLGYDEARRSAISPGLIDVSLDAYGWSGPWTGRRGFDSLVQMSSGIADAGRKWKGADSPVPLPVQALDHGTGYLLAAAAVRGLVNRRLTGAGMTARLSLARTASVLWEAGKDGKETALIRRSDCDLSPSLEATSWGNARRLNPPVVVAEAPMSWPCGASALGSARAAWQEMTST